MAVTGRETTRPEVDTIVDKPADEDFMKEMRDNYDRARQREHENIIEAYLDLGFRCGDAQWDAAAMNDRMMERRPCMVVNIIPQFIRQVTGDIRQMKPGLKVVPVDDKADPKTAEVLSNLIRYIENRSDAQDAYYKAADQQVTAGVGHFRVMREYYSDASFDQEIRVAPIEDGISVLWDPDAILPTREDANFCFVPVDMSRKAFEDKYPGKTADSMEQHDYQWRSEWATDDHVRVSEYWLKKPIKRKLAQMPDGSIIDVDKIEDEAEKAAVLAQGQIRERDGHEVCRYLVSLTDILEDKQTSPGRYIPIVPVFGEEIRIGRRLVRHGMVRFMRDPQRIYNYFASAETEVVALQPKAPWLGTELNFADSLDMWQSANTKNYPFLIYRPDPSNGSIQPSRIAPPVKSDGITEGLKRAEEDMYRVTGVYPSSLGQQSNETSGKAINYRQREGDTGTFVYIDNFARAIKHCGRILVDMIPYVYDTQRTIRILGEDGKMDSAVINKPGFQLQGLDIIKTVENDVTVGVYDVMTQVGPSYTTRREEAKEGMIQLMQTAPQFGPLIMDLVAKAQDWPLADKIAERAHLMLPPQIIMAEQAMEQGMPEEQVLQHMMQQQQGPTPDPKAEAAAAQTKQKMEMDGQAHQLKMAQETQKTQHDVQMGQLNMETEKTLASLKVQQALLDIALKEQQLKAKREQGNSQEKPEHY
jgi:hypothetical protein